MSTKNEITSDSKSTNPAGSSAVNPLEQLIQNVATRAQISESNAEHVVDMVLTSVKRKLPDPMAARLVAVMSGEDDFANSGGAQGQRRSDEAFSTERISETLGDVGENLSRVGGQVVDDATRLGGKAFEEAGRVSSKVAGEAVDVADKFSQWAKEVISKPKN